MSNRLEAADVCDILGHVVMLGACVRCGRDDFEQVVRELPSSETTERSTDR